MDSNLVKRVVFAAVAIPLALLVVWYGGWPLALLVSAVGVLGTRELFALAVAGGNLPLRTTGLVLAGAVPLIAHASLTMPDVGLVVGSSWPSLCALGVVLLLMELLLVRAPDQRPLAAISITIFGVAYASLMPAFLLGIRHAMFGERSWAGAAMVFFPLVVVWVCDSAAMFGGKAFGGPKLAPTISPGKTRSGGLAGMIGGALVAPLFALVVFPRVDIVMSLGAAIVMAVTIALVGQAGDLAESLFKREAGVKDSSNLIPGHGGVLDRFDALYVSLPVAAMLYQWFGLL
jgi:phosphatidate cytidylyltransferase